MSCDPKYTIRWGDVARTIEYEDSSGRIIFTFDPIHVDGKQTIAFDSPTLRGDSTDKLRKQIAFERVKEYVRASGFEVMSGD